MRWRATGRDKDIRDKQLREMVVTKSKTRVDLVTFASSHLGSLGASLLAHVHQVLLLGRLSSTSDLRKASVSAWSRSVEQTGLRGLRDIRELETSGLLVDASNSEQYACAIELVAQRLNSVHGAKDPKGSWQRASLLELLPTTGPARGR